MQSNGDYEVHKEGCYKFPITNIKELGNHLNSESAIKAAEAEYPHLSIDGVYIVLNRVIQGKFRS